MESSEKSDLDLNAFHLIRRSMTKKLEQSGTADIMRAMIRKESGSGPLTLEVIERIRKKIKSMVPNSVKENTIPRIRCIVEDRQRMDTTSTPSPSISDSSFDSESEDSFSDSDSSQMDSTSFSEDSSDTDSNSDSDINQGESANETDCSDSPDEMMDFGKKRRRLK